jgi:RimJ/RimL family protein N-acetyltransferase
MTQQSIVTHRLELLSLSADFIDAALAGHRAEAERLAGLTLPNEWPDEPDARFLRIRLGQLHTQPDWQEWLVRAIALKNGDRTMVGHIGFHGPPEVIGRAEMGYTVFPEFRRRGYAIEAAEALMEWARARHEITRFFVAISPDNSPSLAMAAKLGFARVGEQIDADDGLEYVFELSAP